MDERNWYQAYCSICPATFQCRKQAITARGLGVGEGSRVGDGNGARMMVMVPGWEDERMFSTLIHL